MAGGCERDGCFGLSGLEIFTVATDRIAADPANRRGQAITEESNDSRLVAARSGARSGGTRTCSANRVGSCPDRHAGGNGLFQCARGFGGPAASRRQDRSTPNGGTTTSTATAAGNRCGTSAACDGGSSATSVHSWPARSTYGRASGTSVPSPGTCIEGRCSQADG